MNKKIGLYIHVPFCLRKCPYCDFYSMSIDKDLINQYTTHICNEIKSWSETTNTKADTLYLGGGTPSLLGISNIDLIISNAKKYFDLHDSEITIELNPTLNSKFNFKDLLKSGVNRISFGVQSFCDNDLKTLGRIHNSNQAQKSIALAQDAGCNNISIDLMISTPGQTLSSLDRSLDICTQLNVQHISAYILKIEKNTKFYDLRNSLDLPSEDLIEKMYLYMCSFLTENKFPQYEISNFAHLGYESKHNLKYWQCQEYLGLGPSAHSFLNGRRFHFERDINKFLQHPSIVLDGAGGDEEEFIMLQLRLTDGLTHEAYHKYFGKDIPSVYLSRAANLPHTDTSDGIRFTPEGFLLSNTLIGKILYG